MDFFQRSTARDGGIVRQAPTIKKLQLLQVFQRCDFADITQFAAAVYDQRFQLHRAGEEGKIGDRYSLQPALVQRGTGGKRTEVQPAPQSLSVVDPEPVQFCRCKAREIGLFRTDKVNMDLVQLFAGCQRAVVPEHTPAVQNIDFSQGRCTQPAEVRDLIITE